MVMTMPLLKKNQRIRTRYSGHVTGYQPIRDQYFLIRFLPSVISLLISAQLLHFLLCVLTQLRIIIIIKIERLGDGPLTELVKQDHTTLIQINITELRLCIFDGTHPFLHQLLSSGEFLQVDSPVVISIDSAESYKVLKVLSQGTQEEFELSELDVVVTVSVRSFGFGAVFGDLPGSHDGGFGVKELINADNIPHGFITLGQG
eukprot:sb/3470590/